MPGEPAVARRSGARWKLALRLVVERGVPRRARRPRARPVRAASPSRHPAPHRAPPRSRPLLTVLVGIVLSAWRWQRVLAGVRRAGAAQDPHRALPRRPVRRQRPAVDDRRRRRPRHPLRQDRRLDRRRVRVGRARTAHRDDRRSRCSWSSASCSSRRCCTSSTRGSRCSSPRSRSARSGSSCSRPATRVSPAASRATRTGRASSAPCSWASIAPRHDPPQMLRVLGTAFVYQLSIVLSYLLDLPRARPSVSDRGA